MAGNWRGGSVCRRAHSRAAGRAAAGRVCAWPCPHVRRAHRAGCAGRILAHAADQRDCGAGAWRVRHRRGLGDGAPPFSRAAHSERPARSAVCGFAGGGGLYAHPAVWPHRRASAAYQCARHPGGVCAARHDPGDAVCDAAVYGARANAGAACIWHRAGAGGGDDWRERLADLSLRDVSRAAPRLRLRHYAHLCARAGRVWRNSGDQRRHPGAHRNCHPLHLPRARRPPVYRGL